MADPIGKQDFSNAPVHRSETQASESSGGGAEVGAALGAGLAFAAQLAGKAVGASPFGALPGLLGGGGGSTGLGGVQGDIAQGQNQMMEMLRIQNQMQVQNQQFTTITNVSKMDHDTRMAAVRNIRT